MKKTFAIFLAFSMILALTACRGGEPGTTAASEDTTAAAATEDPASEPEVAPAVEEWYGTVRGMELTLSLAADGSYTLVTGGETSSGTWEDVDGGIVLDGDESAPLYRIDDQLMWQGMGLYLSTEKPENGAYVPADVVTDGVTAEIFNGYWQSAFVDAGGVILPAFELDDVTDVFVEAPRAALGGPLFGDVTVEMTFADGALTWEEDGVSVTLSLQADGLMRMHLSASDSDMTLYLLPAYVEGISPEPVDTEAPDGAEQENAGGTGSN